MGNVNSKAPPIGSLKRKCVPETSLFLAFKFNRLKFWPVPPAKSIALIPPAIATKLAPPTVCVGVPIMN